MQAKQIGYDLAKKLEQSGFPQATRLSFCTQPGGDVHIKMDVQQPEGRLNLLKIGYEIIAAPFLDELIRACGAPFYLLSYSNEIWYAKNTIANGGVTKSGGTPEEAVANLWMALRKES